MKKIVVATHGYFGKELVNSGSLIMGDTLSFGSLSMNEKTVSEDIRNEVKELLANRSEEEGIFILTDVLGGSICNICSEFINEPNYYVLTGVNMPMILELISSMNFLTDEDLIEACITVSQSGITCVNQLKVSEEENLF